MKLPEPIYAPDRAPYLRPGSVPVSVAIITKNEAAQISACLDSVAFAAQVVVVDAESSDATAAVARSKGAEVTVRPWPGYARQRNFGIALCRHDWILSIDADERVSLRLAHEIADLMRRGPAFPAYRVPEWNFYFGRWLRHGGIYPGHHISLFDRRRGVYQEGPADVHEDLHFRESGVLTGPVLHFAYPSFSLALSKLNRYTDLESRGRHFGGRRASAYGMLWRPIERFLKNYVFKAGFLDGWQGLLYCFLCALYAFSMEVKLWELQRSSGLDPEKSGMSGHSQVPERKVSK
jgi:glycosyltransferase involved in cell wall biosynthesis